MSECEILGLTGYLVQIGLGGLSFTILIVKRYFEHPKRLWKIFIMVFYINLFSKDSSKQMISALLALELANKESSNPCVWYFITFFMDCTLGVFFCYLLMKSCNLIFKRYNIRNLQSGNYFYIQENEKPLKPIIHVDWKIYLLQLLLWNSFVIFSKIILFGIQEGLASPLEQFGNWLFSPITNPELELILVMFIIPIILNAFCFWIQDNIIKKNEFSSQEEKQILIGQYYEEEEFSEQTTTSENMQSSQSIQEMVSL